MWCPSRTTGVYEAVVSPRRPDGGQRQNKVIPEYEVAPRDEGQVRQAGCIPRRPRRGSFVKVDNYMLCCVCTVEARMPPLRGQISDQAGISRTKLYEPASMRQQ